MHDMDIPDVGQANAASALRGDPPSLSKGPLPRVRLDSMERVRSEMVRLYQEGKHGRREVQDVSRLANVLTQIGRLIEGSDVERRLAALEEKVPKR